MIMRRASRAIIIRDDKLLVMKRNKFGRHYYTLIGGGIDFNETPEQSLVREVKEETGLDITKYKQVFTEEAGEPYGTQFIYLVEDPGGEAVLQASSEEARISSGGKNTYAVTWVRLSELEKSAFLSTKLKHAILRSVSEGFPDQPILL